MNSHIIFDRAGNSLINRAQFPEYNYSFSHGVHRFLLPETKHKLDAFLPVFEKFREKRGDRITDTSEFSKLPFTNLEPQIWKNRQRDVQFISTLTTLKKKRVLEVGSWNGWLANGLSKKGANVTAIDYFSDKNDGLRARAFYENPTWTSIQMDCEDLTVFSSKFDLIIYNWNTTTLSNPLKTLTETMAQLAPGGKIILLGLNVFKNTKQAANHFKNLKAHFKKKYKVSLGLRPFKGYFSNKDLEDIVALGFETSAYQHSIKGAIKSIVKPEAPVLYRAVFHKPTTMQ